MVDRPPSIIHHLNALQEAEGWLPEPKLRELSALLGVPLHRIEGVASFYPHYRRRPPADRSVAVCRDLSCAMAGAAACLAEAKAAAQAHETATGERVEITEVSCLGRCERAPAFLIDHQRPVAGIAGLRDALAAGDAHGDLPPAESSESSESSVSSGSPPLRIDCERPSERYRGFRRLVAGGDAAAEATLAALKEADLRGMGGAGFPTATKWGFVRNAGDGGEKFVICNADESEPGTFKDRELLARVPHRVWEGVMIAAVVVGARRGIIFLRHEYEPERRHLAAEQVAAQATADALGLDLTLEIFVSPGGYIMGEETALLEALEDRRGEPRNKPPFPGIEGLFGRPTLINNVETLAIAAAITDRGAAWWRAQGIRGCAGFKFIGISGDVAHPGCFEVPMGTTLRELIDLAGGIRGGASLAAILPGGASSAFLPPDRVDTPLDFDQLRDAGSSLGSGAVVVVAEGRDLLEVGLSLTRFFRNESCGKCVPCRVGSEKAVTILEELQAGTAAAPRRHLQLLEELDATMAQTSICGLGQVALLPALSLFRTFPALATALGGEAPR